MDGKVRRQHNYSELFTQRNQQKKKNKSRRALGPRARNRVWTEETSRLMDQFSAGQVYVNAPPRNSDISSDISYAADKAQVGSRQR